jgi:hypothetical protein
MFCLGVFKMRLSLLFLVTELVLSTDPCSQLCARDGPTICPGGSWNRNGICHAYMFLGQSREEYCYHTARTAATCPSNGSPVRVEDAQRLLNVNDGGRNPPRMDSSFVREYEALFKRCKEYLVPRDESKVLDPYDLVKKKAVIVAEGIGPLHVEAELGQGMFGKALSFANNKHVLLKGAKSGHGRDDLCWERSMLRVLREVSRGGIPREYKVTWMNVDEELFKNRVIVMDRVGDMEWGEFRHGFDRHFINRLIVLLNTLRGVHERGFLHFDIKGANIRVSATDSSKVFLIDFGQGRPFIDFEGNHLPDWELSRQTDLLAVTKLIEESLPGLNTAQVFAAFNQEILSLPHDACPDYDRLIRLLSSVSW